MAFDLYLEFVGLCLFVPDDTTGALHVLMPAVTPSREVPEHVVRLCFDAAYLQQGSATASGVTGQVPARRVQLALGTSGIDLSLPEDLVSVGAETKRPVFPDALYGDDPQERLSARVRLTAGACAAHDPGACWSYPDKEHPRRLSNRVTWKMTIGEDSLRLVFTALSGGTKSDLPPLYPIRETTGDTIRMAIYHTTRDDLPPEPIIVPEPAPDTPAHHFMAFYNLFEPPLTSTPVPLFIGLNCDEHGYGGTPYTCMGAQTPPMPAP